VLQSLLGFGIVSYYGEPLLYLAAGAVLAFVFGKRASSSPAVGFGCGLAFLFHPLLDTVCYRPMPDLSEGVWGGVVLLGWSCLMQAPSRGRGVLFALLTGLAIFIAESNRITGVFIIPVLLVATALFFPRRFGWLVLAGFFAAVFYGLECCFYKWLFDDWLHNLHANLGAKGNKGTEAIALWSLPLRFIDTLFQDNPIAPAYCLFGTFGGWIAWRRLGVPGRLMVVWFAVLYLEYSCAPQSLFPYRPLIRDADRFLCGLAIPMSVLAVLGLAALFQPAWLGRWKAGAWIAQRPALTVALGLVILAAATSRSYCDIGFVPQMRRYMETLPTGTKIFSHPEMRALAYLVDARAAQRFTWTIPNAILHRENKLEAQAAQCTELWYARKLVWLMTRKSLEKHGLTKQKPLASYFDHPEREWVLEQLLAKGDTPDLVFYRRRTPDSPPPLILGPDAPEWQQLIPTLPAHLDRSTEKGTIRGEWHIPAELKGRLARFEIEAASAQVEAMTIRLWFVSDQGRKRQSDYVLKPYLYAEGGKDFFVLPIPAESDTCDVQLRMAKKAKDVVVTGFRAVIESRKP
jgi:hypothetical protein